MDFNDAVTFTNPFNPRFSKLFTNYKNRFIFFCGLCINHENILTVSQHSLSLPNPRYFVIASNNEAKLRF